MEQLVPYFIVLAVTVVVSVIFLLGNQLDKFVKAKTTNEQYKILNSIVSDAVLAAEQYLHSKEGEAKKEYVMEQAAKMLADREIKIDADHLGMLVESAVYYNLKYLRDSST